MVDRILAAKQREAGADTTALEQEIDRLIYALYGLTPAEIKLVESASVKTSAFAKAMADRTADKESTQK
ncbi:MAG: hypothetical protein ABSH21_03170 [Verrucomicrobiia bacterium]